MVISKRRVAVGARTSRVSVEHTSSDYKQRYAQLCHLPGSSDVATTRVSPKFSGIGYCESRKIQLDQILRRTYLKEHSLKVLNLRINS